VRDLVGPMNEERYVRDLSAALTGMPRAQRDAIVADVRVHIGSIRVQGRTESQIFAGMAPVADVADRYLEAAGLVPARVARLHIYDLALLAVCLVAAVAALIQNGIWIGLVAVLPVAGAAVVAMTPDERRASARFVLMCIATGVVVVANLLMVVGIDSALLGAALNATSLLSLQLWALIVMGWTGVVLEIWLRRPHSRALARTIHIVVGLLLAYWALFSIQGSIHNLTPDGKIETSVTVGDGASLVGSFVLGVLAVAFFWGRRGGYVALAVFAGVLLLLGLITGEQRPGLNDTFAVLYLACGLAGWTALASPAPVSARTQAALVE